MGKHMQKPHNGRKAKSDLPASSVIPQQAKKPVGVGVADPSRRKFLEFGAVLTAYMAVPTTLATGWYLEEKVAGLSSVQERLFGLERSERAKSVLFPSSGKLDVVPARHSPTAKIARFSYPNEEYAVEAIQALFPEDKLGVKTRDEEVYPVQLGHSMVCIGSSVSNLGTRQVLGPPEHPSFRHKHKGANFAIEFPYSIATTNEHVSRLQDGNPDYRVPVKAIVDRNGVVAIPHVKEYLSSRKLDGDVLLVSKLPLHLGSTEQLLFSSAHGPGIRAVKNIFSHISREDLEYLERVAKDEQYFQAIFAIENLYEKDGTTFPGEIRLLKGEKNRPQRVNVKMV